MPATELRLADVEAFGCVLRSGSVSGAARALGMGAPGVSKAIARLERYLGAKLLVRGAQGVALSERGRELAPQLLEVLKRSRDLRVRRARSEVIVAAPSFVWALLSRNLGSLAREFCVHALETSSVTMSALAGQPLFDAAIGVGSYAWRGPWVKVEVGTARWALFAAPSHARRLGRRVAPAALGEELFVGRFVLERGQIVETDDRCPLSMRARRFGHRAQTVGVALELARQAGQLVFAPELAARGLVRRGALVEVPVKGWSVAEPVQVVCHADRVSARAQRALGEAARAILEEPEG